MPFDGFGSIGDWASVGIAIVALSVSIIASWEKLKRFNFGCFWKGIIMIILAIILPIFFVFVFLPTIPLMILAEEQIKTFLGSNALSTLVMIVIQTSLLMAFTGAWIGLITGVFRIMQWLEENFLLSAPPSSWRRRLGEWFNEE